MGACMCHRPRSHDKFGDRDNTANWMAKAGDRISITDLSVPGTHESMCLYGGCWLQCQRQTLPQQYLAGLRFVDIRCRHFNDELPIYHAAIYQHATFDDVLRDTLAFLAEHPQEVIFMRVREEYLPEHNTKTFAEAVQVYVDRYPSGSFWTGTKAPCYPVLGETRGKVVIFRNYSGPATFGLPYDGLDIEDTWDVGSLTRKDIARKWHLVKSHLEKANQGPSDSAMYLTYSSGTGVFARPRSVARRLNKCLLRFISAKRMCGVVAMDFPDPELMNRIIHSN